MAPEGRGHVRGYAEGLLLVAEAEGAEEKVEDELFRFARALESSGDLRDTLTDLAIPADRKKGIIEDLLSDKASPQTRTILGFIVEQGRARELPAIVDELVRLAAERRQSAVAEVRVATDLSDEQKSKLAEALSRATGRTVELKVVKDPSIVGGVVARIGDQIIDGSVRRRLALARDRMSQV